MVVLNRVWLLSLHEPCSITDTNSVHIASVSERSSSLKLSKV